MGNTYKPGHAALCQALVEHIKSIEKYYGQKGLSAAKRHLGLYVHSHAHAGALRKRIHESNCWRDIQEIIHIINQG